MADVRSMMADVLVTLEDVTSVNLVLHIIQHCVIAVGYDGFALSLEFIKVVDNL